MGGNRESYLENVWDPSDRKAAVDIPLPLGYGTALPELQAISLQSFLSEAGLGCCHFSHCIGAASWKEKALLAARCDVGEWMDVASGVLRVLRCRRVLMKELI